MLEYKRGSEVEPELCYEAFRVGFVDTIVRVEMDRQVFLPCERKG